MEGRKGPALLARKENVLGAVFPVTFLFYFFSLAWVISPLPKFSTPFDHVWDRLQNYVPPCRSDGHVHLQILFLKWPWTSPPSSRSVNESAKTRASFASLSRFKSRQVTAWDKVSPIRGLLFQLVEHDLLNGLVKLSSPSPDPVNCMGRPERHLRDHDLCRSPFMSSLDFLPFLHSQPFGWQKWPCNRLVGASEIGRPGSEATCLL